MHLRLDGQQVACELLHLSLVWNNIFKAIYCYLVNKIFKNFNEFKYFPLSLLRDLLLKTIKLVDYRAL